MTTIPDPDWLMVHPDGPRLLYVTADGRRCTAIDEAGTGLHSPDTLPLSARDRVILRALLESAIELLDAMPANPPSQIPCTRCEHWRAIHHGYGCPLPQCPCTLPYGGYGS